MSETYQRIISFENILNFRDLGVYRTADHRSIAWKRLFRSGGLLEMSEADKGRLKTDIELKTVIDLRSPKEPEKLREIKLLEKLDIEYFNKPFRPDNPDYFKEEMELYQKFSNMGDIYLHRISHKSFGKRFVEVLEIMASRKNYPLLFHCGAGKDRTGILAAIILEVLGVPDEEIIDDYALTGPFMEKIRSRWLNAPDIPEEVKNLPDFAWRAVPEYMKSFLSLLRNQYGSVKGYLETMGADPSLVDRLKEALLV